MCDLCVEAFEDGLASAEPPWDDNPVGSDVRELVDLGYYDDPSEPVTPVIEPDYLKGRAT
jgi:hypothetical protein